MKRRIPKLTDHLSEKLGCPVVNTVSTSDKFSRSSKTAASLKGKEQKAPYTQEILIYRIKLK